MSESYGPHKPRWWSVQIPKLAERGLLVNRDYVSIDTSCLSEAPEVGKILSSSPTDEACVPDVLAPLLCEVSRSFGLNRFRVNYGEWNPWRKSGTVIYAYLAAPPRAQ